jgi:hypothetical protein
MPSSARIAERFVAEFFRKQKRQLCLSSIDYSEHLSNLPRWGSLSSSPMSRPTSAIRKRWPRAYRGRWAPHGRIACRRTTLVGGAAKASEQPWRDSLDDQADLIQPEQFCRRALHCAKAEALSLISPVSELCQKPLIGAVGRLF